MKYFVGACTFFTIITAISGSALPIWELLSREEKMGRLFYVFVHLVEQYCKTSDIPDCPKVLTLYGMSNLVNDDDLELNSLDPYQKNARSIIWEKIMRGEFRQPNKGVHLSVSQHLDASEDEEPRNNSVFQSRPYEVRVKPPAGFTYKPVSEPQRRPLSDFAKSGDDSDASAIQLSNGSILLRPGRSVRSERFARSILLRHLKQ